jgi:hypothetical protein
MTEERAAVIRSIEVGFARTHHPGGAFLVGSREGCEPEEVCGPFRAYTDWRALDATFLDASHPALSFFSEGAFRFFLPAYLVADVEDKLSTADPMPHLIGPFFDGEVTVTDAAEPAHPIVRRFGGSVLLNPRRYGAALFRDYGRYRLSVFCREEACAIVDYLRFKQRSDTMYTTQIQAALDAFWVERAAHAPTADDLQTHLDLEARYTAHLERKYRTS